MNKNALLAQMMIMGAFGPGVRLVGMDDIAYAMEGKKEIKPATSEDFDRMEAAIAKRERRRLRNLKCKQA